MTQPTEARIAEDAQTRIAEQALDDLVARLDALLPPPYSLHVGGAYAAGDFVAGVTDLAAVALLAAPPDAALLADLRRLHTIVDAAHPVVRPSVIYIEAAELPILDARHHMWRFGQDICTPLGRLARADLGQHCVTLRGSQNPFPELDRDGLREAARADLRTYWAAMLRNQRQWLQTPFADYALVTLARIDGVLSEGRLLDRRHALDRLAHLGISGRVCRQLRERQRGMHSPASFGLRLSQAMQTTRLCRQLLHRIG